VYTDQSESVQLHDFNPGFGPDVGGGARTFWTVAIPENDVTVELGAGNAEMKVDKLAIRDYGNIPTALGPGFDSAYQPAVVSFDVVWSGPITRQVDVTNGTLGNNYAGNYVENQVTVNWSGTNTATGFSFTANPGTLATSSVDGGFAELGHESNGIFFSPDDSAARLATETPPGHSTDLLQAARLLGQTTMTAAPTASPLAARVTHGPDTPTMALGTTGVHGNSAAVDVIFAAMHHHSGTSPARITTNLGDLEL
jgi:hypothetical protein